MSRAGFELAIPATKRPQTYVLDRSATGIGFPRISLNNYFLKVSFAAVRVGYKGMFIPYGDVKFLNLCSVTCNHFSGIQY
jgi:hypothetical protein